MAFDLSVCFMFVLLCHTTAVVSDSTETDNDSAVTVSNGTDDSGVRCYCNAALCVSTGYMCRATSSGGCYSELTPRSSSHHARYGCLHHLAESEEQAMKRCQNDPPSTRASSTGTTGVNKQQTLLLCCFRDLCNHEDSPLFRRRLNLTGIESVADCVAYNSSEVWLKAATIAVPVCGAIILFLLVAIAIRMLRADHKLSAPYMSQPLQTDCTMESKKPMFDRGVCAPLLVQAGGCLIRVDKVELNTKQDCEVFCDIQR